MLCWHLRISWDVPLAVTWKNGLTELSAILPIHFLAGLSQRTWFLFEGVEVGGHGEERVQRGPAQPRPPPRDGGDGGVAEDVIDAEAADPGLGGPHPAAAQLRVRVLVTAMVDSVGS